LIAATAVGIEIVGRIACSRSTRTMAVVGIRGSPARDFAERVKNVDVVELSIG
jgi:hypothetical protein